MFTELFFFTETKTKGRVGLPLICSEILTVASAFVDIFPPSHLNQTKKPPTHPCHGTTDQETKDLERSSPWHWQCPKSSPTTPTQQKKQP
jgi:hypothetical protein